MLLWQEICTELVAIIQSTCVHEIIISTHVQKLVEKCLQQLIMQYQFSGPVNAVNTTGAKRTLALTAVDNFTTAVITVRIALLNELCQF